MQNMILIHDRICTEVSLHYLDDNFLYVYVICDCKSRCALLQLLRENEHKEMHEGMMSQEMVVDLRGREGKRRSRLPRRRSWRRLSSTLRRTGLVILVILLHCFADVILRHRRVIIDNLALVGATRTRACDRRWRAWWWRGWTSRRSRCLWWAWWLDASSGRWWLRRWSCVVGGNFGFRLFYLKINNSISNQPKCLQDGDSGMLL